MVTIYKRGTNLVRALVQPSASSQQERNLMERDIVALSFDLPLYVNFEIGDYANIFGYLYKMNTLPDVRKIADKNYTYNAILEASLYDLAKVQFLDYDSTNTLGVSDFYLNLNPRDFLLLIVANMNRHYNGGWVAGFASNAEVKNLNFSAQNCLEAIAVIAEAFETEYLVENRTISLFRRQTHSGLVFKQGLNEALISITRQNQDSSNVITKLYAYGSTRNIGGNYRNGATRLRMPDSLLVERNPNNYEGVEASKIFEDIYPERQGVVTATADKYTFSDTGIDFNVNNQLMPGLTAKITFNSGNLAGYTFDVSTYNHTTKIFVINPNSSERSIDVPSDLLRPATGDKYVLTDILMPATYVTNAELRLKEAAESHIATNGPPKFKYIAVSNPVYFKENAYSFEIGQLVTLNIPDMAINTEKRFIGFTRNLRNPYSYTIELAEQKVTQPFFKAINNLR